MVKSFCNEIEFFLTASENNQNSAHDSDVQGNVNSKINFPIEIIHKIILNM